MEEIEENMSNDYNIKLTKLDALFDSYHYGDAEKSHTIDEAAMKELKSKCQITSKNEVEVQTSNESCQFFNVLKSLDPTHLDKIFRYLAPISYISFCAGYFVYYIHIFPSY